MTNNIIHEIEKYFKREISNISMNKLNVGFTNDVYLIEDKVILKICNNIKNETKFEKEIEFYNNNKENSKVPKLIVSSSDTTNGNKKFIIMEKINGISLYNIWHTLNNNEREEIIKQIAEFMKNTHKNIGPKIDWSKYITDKLFTNLDKIKDLKLITNNQYNEYLKIIKDNAYVLKSDEFNLVHADLHFDNILIDEDKNIKLIDFETSMYAPIDYELDIFLRMCKKPLKFASEEAEQFVKNEDYNNIEFWLKKYYPKIFDFEYSSTRLLFYALEAELRLIPRFPEDSELLTNSKDILEKIKINTI